jgi:hypothetical protein
MILRLRLLGLPFGLLLEHSIHHRVSSLHRLLILSKHYIFEVSIFIMKISCDQQLVNGTISVQFCQAEPCLKLLLLQEVRVNKVVLFNKE